MAPSFNAFFCALCTNRNTAEHKTLSAGQKQMKERAQKRLALNMCMYVLFT